MRKQTETDWPIERRQNIRIKVLDRPETHFSNYGIRGLSKENLLETIRVLHGGIPC